MPSWVIVGASRGIGLEFVRQLAGDSSNIVFALVRNKETSNHLTPLVGGNVHVFEADLSDHKTLVAAAAEVAKVTGGSLDVLINNGAKITDKNSHVPPTAYQGIEDQVEIEFMDAMRVNVLGVAHSMNAFIPLLRAGPTKKIINLSSAAGEVDFVRHVHSTEMTAYGCSKAALNILTAQFANVLAEEGFICVSFSPGIVDTKETTPGNPGVQFPGFERVVQAIKNAYPDWTPVSYEPKESVARQLATIAGLKPEDNGAFLSEKGAKELFKD